MALRRRLKRRHVLTKPLKINSVPAAHAVANRQAHGRAISRATTKEDTLSKLDFISYLTSTLTNASTKLLETDPTTAGRLNQIVRTAENISPGYWAQFAPLYDPLAPKLQLSVATLNTSIIGGQAVPDFDSYVALLAVAVQA